MTILGAVLRPVFKFLSKRRQPVVDGVLVLEGLKDEVQVLRDKNGTPHIIASNEEDLFFAMGFVHAQDRLWQMELNRLTSRGQLSSVFGEVALDTDRAVRIFGFERIGKQDWELAPSHVKKAIQSYINGINAFLHHKKSKLPLEFSLVKYSPRDWVIEDVMALTRFMAWNLSHAWYGELLRAEIWEKIGEELAKYLEIHYPKENAVILPKGIEFRELRVDGVYEKTHGPFLSRNAGSNSFVISGQYTESGKPLVAHDVHLPLSTPELWYEAHQKTPDFTGYGVTIPGLPFILIGQNKYFAWCMTLAYTDAADVYVEKFDPATLTCEYEEEQYKVTVLEEIIKIKGKPDHVEKVVITKHGPIISDILTEQKGKYLAVKDAALLPAPILEAWYDLNHGKSWNDFVHAVEKMKAPQLNVSYADIYGNIGYWTSGIVPKRRKGDGRFPVPGWISEYEWDGFIPFEEMPHALNPEQGFIVTANNKIIPDDFPHYLGNVWMNGYRAQRITQLIKEKIEKGEKLRLEDGNRIMRDVFSIPSREFVKHLKEIDLPSEELHKMREILVAWNGFMEPELIGPTLYQVIKYSLIRTLLEEKLGKELTEKIMGVGFNPVLLPANEFQGQDVIFLLRILKEKTPWLPSKEAKNQAIIKSMEKAWKWLQDNLGKNMNQWKYERIHKAIFNHAFAINPPMDEVFNAKAIPIRGGNDTPFQTAYDPSQPFNNNFWSPSFRFLVDLAKPGESKATTALGQSGILGSKHYEDKKIAWAQGEYHDTYFTSDLPKAAVESKLMLQPLK